ncbi:calcium-binding protein, partial [Methylorubrum sp. SB2]|uniref:beta strand repeat-containing protein n=1 Tax=Methylorubrum subtropicum TaxID=3138812 RepID=UPI00313A83CA
MSGGDDIVNAGDGQDSVYGDTGDDAIYGEGGDDLLVDDSEFRPSPGTDKLYGGVGEDWLVIRSASLGDIADGGSDDDTIELDFTDRYKPSSSLAVTFTLTANSTVFVDGAATAVVKNAEYLVFKGAAGADTVTGGAKDDEIDGNGGDDVLKGLGGDDWIDSGTGLVDIDGGEGHDYASFDLSGATDSFTLKISPTISLGIWGKVLNVEDFGFISTGSGNDTITAGDGGSTINSGAGDDTVTGGAGDDIINPGDGKNVVRGGGGNDRIAHSSQYVPFTADETFYGDGGDDILNSAFGNDTIDGGTGNDVIASSGGNDIVDGGDGDDTISGDADGLRGTSAETKGDDRLSGGAGNDLLSGGLGKDTLDGGSGDDTLILDPLRGGEIDAAVDTLIGGTGFDTLRFGVSNSDVADTGDVSVAVAENLVLTIGGKTVATGSSIEALYVEASLSTRLKATGGASSDIFRLYGTSSDTIDAGAGDDEIRLYRGSDTATGGDGNDLIAFTLGGRDVIDAGANDDIIYVAGSTETLTAPASIKGGSGHNTLSFVANSDAGYAYTYTTNAILLNGKVVATLSGFDAFIFGAQNAGAGTFKGTQFADTLIFSNGTNTIETYAGDDTIKGGSGADTIDGGVGNDTADYNTRYYTSISVTLNGANYASVSVGGVVEDKIKNVENVIGAFSADTLTGDTLANTLDGSFGDDILSGGDGSDTLIGHFGADTLNGGNGDDILVADVWDPGDFYIPDGADTIDGGAGIDTVDYGFAASAVTVVLNGATYATVTYANSADDRVRNVENVVTGSGNDKLTGDGNANVLDGGLGADTLSGGAGSDTYVVDNAGDLVIEAANAGTDTVRSSVSFTLAANIESLTLIGTAAVNGTGNTGVNTITGNGANNVLNGGAGADILTGGAGSDTYVVDNAGDRVVEAKGGGADRVVAGISYALAAGQEI